MIGFNKETILEIEKLGFTNEPLGQLRCIFYHKKNPKVTIQLGNYPYQEGDGAYVFLWDNRENKGDRMFDISDIREAVNNFICL